MYGVKVILQGGVKSCETELGINVDRLVVTVGGEITDVYDDRLNCTSEDAAVEKEAYLRTAVFCDGIGVEAADDVDGSLRRLDESAVYCSDVFREEGGASAGRGSIGVWWHFCKDAKYDCEAPCKSIFSFFLSILFPPSLEVLSRFSGGQQPVLGLMDVENVSDGDGVADVAALFGFTESAGI